MAYDWQRLQRLGFWSSLFFRFVVSVLGSIAIGFLPEAFVGRMYYNTGLEAYSPLILVVAGCLGYGLNKRLGHSAARWIWVLGVAWLAYGAFEESTYWYNSGAATRMQYVLDNFFSRTSVCSASECLGEFFFTTPCAVSIVYSAAAAVGLRSQLRGRNDKSGFPLVDS
jgi:hypothetical protein